MPDNFANKPRCQHLKDDGTRCGCFALRGKSHCYFHDRQRLTPSYRPRPKIQFTRRSDFFNVQTPDDVMLALNHVMNGIITGQLSDREAGAIIFALQFASAVAPYTAAAANATPRVPHPFAQRKRGSVDSLNVSTSHSLPFFDPPDDFPAPPPNWRPKCAEDFFELVPDLKDILTPKDIAFINSSIEPRPE